MSTQSGKPMVIVSKPSPIITAPIVNQANKSSSSQQPPLIVFDLGQQHQQQQQQVQNQQTTTKESESDVKNNVLSDILKSTGIIETDMASTASTMEAEASTTPPPLRSAVDQDRGTYSRTTSIDCATSICFVVTGSSERNNGKAVDLGAAALLQDEFVADAQKPTGAGMQLHLLELVIELPES